MLFLLLANAEGAFHTHMQDLCFETGMKNIITDIAYF
jgi:hypothetical protein